MNITRKGEPGVRAGAVLVVEDGAGVTGTGTGAVAAVTGGNVAAVVPVSTVLLAGTTAAA